MCGITGISRAIGTSSIPDPRHFMKLATLAIEERGKDATGFAWVRSDGKSFYWKSPGRAREQIVNAPLDTDITTAIGHTRWATQGDVKRNENNHPVVDDGIMLVHNGVIENEGEIYAWLGDDFVPPAEVDSQAAASMLARPAEFYSSHPTEMLELIEGTAAFAWILPDKPDELHLARLNSRPMHIGWTRYGDLVMSSTESTLSDLALWSNVRLVKTRKIEEGTYLRVIGGEIVEEQSFKTRRRTSYTTHSTGKSTTYNKKGKSGKETGSDRSLVVVGAEPKKNETIQEWYETEPWYIKDPEYYDFMFERGIADPIEEHSWHTAPDGFDDMAPRRGWID